MNDEEFKIESGIPIPETVRPARKFRSRPVNFWATLASKMGAGDSVLFENVINAGSLRGSLANSPEFRGIQRRLPEGNYRVWKIRRTASELNIGDDVPTSAGPGEWFRKQSEG